jgi:hypothetical protein
MNSNDACEDLISLRKSHHSKQNNDYGSDYD